MIDNDEYKAQTSNEDCEKLLSNKTTLNLKGVEKTIFPLIFRVMKAKEAWQI